MKKEAWKSITDSYLILLSTFIATWFFFNEYFDLGIRPSIVLLITGAVTFGLVVWSKKTEVADYILIPVIILDGYFHLTSPLENLVANSPDWVIAFNLYQGEGMPVIIHQLMGVFLLLASGWFIYLLISKGIGHIPYTNMELPS